LASTSGRWISTARRSMLWTPALGLPSASNIALWAVFWAIFIAGLLRWAIVASP